MGQRDVLSLDSVDRIRFYVRKKYEHLSKEKHAEIVADAIVQVITRQLPEFDAALKESICQELITKVIIAEQRPVSLQDIDQISSRQVVQYPQAQHVLEEWRTERGVAANELASGVWEGEKSWRDKLTTAIVRKHKAIAYSFGCLVIIGGVLTAQLLQQQEAAVVSEPAVQQAQPVEKVEQLPPNELPTHYQYHEVNDEKLKQYLNSRSSLLAEQRYYDVIVATAKQFNISPLLLFAITGQEQGFVPRDHEQAEEIANNPFNVFHSWQDYNTTIEKSTEIAARTIVNLSKGRPDDVEAIAWINRKYAEDPNWSKGVTSLFATITNYIND